MDFRTASVIDLAAQVRSGQRTATELVDHALGRIAAHNPTVNAFVAVDEERARAAAAAVDATVTAGGDPGPLAGIPLGVKDLEDAAGYVTTHGSAAYADGPPATHDSVLVGRLVAAGCVVVGKTNTPELGWKADSENPLFGATCNPWNLDHTPGGSSGGSGAAIAAGMVPLATGSDGGGSLRIPSACNGLSGFKASLGRVPSGGPNPPDWAHLSTKGPMARRMVDLVAALDVVVGPDPTDLRSLPRPEASWPAAVAEPHVPAKVAWSPTLGYAEIDTEVLELCRRGIDALADLGADVVEVDTVFDEDPIDSWLTLSGAYNLRTHADLRGHRRLRPGRPGTPAHHRRGGDGQCPRRRPGRGHLPPAQPGAGRPLPRRAAPGHPDHGRSAAAAIARRCRVDQREDGLQLGEDDLRVQHDPVTGGHRVRGAQLGRPAGRTAAGRAAACRPGRHPGGGGPRGGPRVRRGGALPDLTARRHASVPWKCRGGSGGSLSG